MKHLKSLFDLLLFPFLFLMHFSLSTSRNKYSYWGQWKKGKLFLLLFVVSSTSTYAVELVNEQFSSNINGWSVSNSSKVYWISDHSGSMFVDRRDWGEETYNFGSTYANQTLDVELRWCATDQWESNNDFLRIKVNGNTVEEDYDGGGCQTITFTADADNNGDFTIRFEPRSSANNEDAHIDWFTIDGSPISTGCDNSLDSNANNNSPGVAVPNLDGTSSDASKCISGSSANDDYEYYHFTVTADGTLDILTSSPNGHNNHFEVISSTQGTLHGYDTGRNRNLSYNLVSGESIVILFKETGNDTDWWQANLNFIADIVAETPPDMNPIPDQTTLEDTSYSLDISSYVTLTNGDPITQYNLTCLPSGLSFNSTTGILSGTPTTAATHNCNATAEDNDGLSNSVSFTLTITPQTPPIMNNIPTQTATKDSLYNFDISSYVTLTDGDAISVYTLTGILPTGLNFDTSTGIISGIPTVEGTYNLSVTATDNDGESNADNFSIIVSDILICANLDGAGNDSEAQATIVTEMDGIDYNKSACIIGDSQDDDSDYYKFTVAADGHLKIDGSSPNGHSYYMKVWSGGSTYYGSTASDTHDVPVISLRAGTTIYIRLKETGSDRDEYQVDFTFVAEDIGNVSGDRPFTIRNPIDTRNINGNYVIGGNMSLCEDNGHGQCRNDNSNSNSNADIYIDIDGDSRTKNSTSFDLDIPAESTVIWAGLYWQGVVHRSIHNGDYMGTTIPSNAPLLGGSTNQIDLTNNTYDADIVKLKLPGNSEYTTVTADQLDYAKLGYGGFADVTTLLDLTNPNGTYMLADVKCHTGAEPDHGNYGGWSLVVIYNNPNEDFRNVTVFDGFATVDSSYNKDLLIEGFLTPKKAPINSKIAFFTMDGEGGSGGTLKVISDSLGGTFVSNADNPANRVFNSTITGVNNRQPNYPSLRLDLDVFELADILGPNEKKAILQPRSGGDRYTASYFIMSSDLIQPELCYDYDLQVGYVKIASEDRQIDTYQRGGAPLTMKLHIRSMIADFIIEDTKAYVKFTPSTGFKYKQGTSEISPAGINAYIPATVLDTSIGKMAIGHKPWTTGGTINPDESTYTKQDFDFNKSSFTGEFNIIIEAKIDYLQDGNPFSYTISTKNNTIKKCPSNPIYDPIQGMFNIENATTASTAPISERYPLYTQVSGRPYNITLAHYTQDANGVFNVPVATDAIIEVELIKADSYDNNASTGYDSTCQEPTAATQGGFIAFNNDPTGRITFNPINDFPNYDSKISLRSAAFRMWLLVDQSSGGVYSLVKHSCTSASNKSCFQTLYTNEYESNDDNDTQYCKSSCSPSETHASACYDCLRKYFAVPLCSRDNFAIRPESFQISVKDTNESVASASSVIVSENNISNNTGDLAAEYSYALNINSTIYPNLGTKSIGYYNDKFTSNLYTSSTLPDITQESISLALLKFNDNVSCVDKSSRTFELQFYDSQLSKEYNLSHTNVGSYDFNINDSSWTEVDQARYIYKTEFGAGKVNDCDITSSSVNQQSKDVGCIISSVLNTRTTINLDFKPYSFDLSSVAMTLPNANNFIYVNQLNTINSTMLHMAAKLEGNITALGKLGTSLSNYTDSCAAAPLLFDINRTMARENNVIDESSISSIDLVSTIPVNTNIHLQRLYIDKDGIPDYSTENNLTASSTAFTITKNQFLDDLNGSANIELYYNLERINNKVMNPVFMTFISKEANASSASSAAHLGTFIPRGTSGINTATNLYYGRVAPSSEAPYLVPRSETNTVIPMYVEAYCNDLDMNCTQHQLFMQSLRDTGGEWWVNTNHISLGANGDGNMITLADMQVGGPLTITPSSNVFLNSDPINNKTDILVSINPAQLRPYNTTIIVVPNVWLNYNPNGILNPILNFLGGGGWAGKGNTGNIVNTKPYFDDQNKRSEW